MTAETMTPAEAPPGTETVRIDFLFLDLTTCTRCRGTDRSLGAALTAVADVLAAAGIEVGVNKVHVASEEQARALRFVSSPTIRVNGADIALELRESFCGSEACTEGCGDQIAHTEPAQAETTEAAETGCCPVAEQQTCCDASAKADCCGSSAEQGCGCR